MDRGELPSRTTVARLLGRTLSLALAVFAMASAGTFFLTFAGRHDDSSNLLPFGGWQVYLAALAIAVIGFALFVTGSLGMRRYRLPPETPRTYQILAAFIAIILGVSVAQAFHHQPERAYNWAAGYTAGAKHEKAQDAAVERQMLGDATHPPMPFAPDGVVPFPTAPESVAGPLLRASDLGVDWYSEGPPRGAFTDATQPGTAVGIRSSAQISLAQEKWNGTRWVQNLGLLESVRRFATPREARSYTATEVASSRLTTPPSQTSTPRVRRWQMNGVTVWSERSGSLSVSNEHMFLTIGSAALLIDVIPAIQPTLFEPLGPTPAFPRVTDRQIVAAAIHRAESAG